MKVFLDTSVLLAACGRPDGASAIIVRDADARRLTLFASEYVIDEVARNLHKLGERGVARWSDVSRGVIVVKDVLTLDRIAVFFPGKDRPILFTALDVADLLLTLDRRDFLNQIGKRFYGLLVDTPGAFLERVGPRPR